MVLHNRAASRTIAFLLPIGRLTAKSPVFFPFYFPLRELLSHGITLLLLHGFQLLNFIPLSRIFFRRFREGEGKRKERTREKSGREKEKREKEREKEKRERERVLLRKREKRLEREEMR
mmetsp:Transcript_8290/g.12959  ORF Transcript_8290/g.12959 Transcript_8290/m.12959 type:complete len:119 (+) Transcript_8290:98-454(+)